MLADAGAKFVILGHSERRTGHNESNELVRAKAEAALAAGMRVIMCCGEDAATREKGGAEAFVLAQLRASLPPIENATERLTVAYQPIWAIGTGNRSDERRVGTDGVSTCRSRGVPYI